MTSTGCGRVRNMNIEQHKDRARTFPSRTSPKFGRGLLFIYYYYNYYFVSDLGKGESWKTWKQQTTWRERRVLSSGYRSPCRRSSWDDTNAQKQMCFLFFIVNGDDILFDVVVDLICIHAAINHIWSQLLE